MSRLLASLCCLLLLIASVALSAFAVRVEGRISTNEVLKELTDLSPYTRVTLNGGQFSALVRKDGKFAIEDVPKGSYLLEVESVEYIYPKMTTLFLLQCHSLANDHPQIRLDVRDKDKGIRSTYTVMGNEWSILGHQLAYPLNITAKAQAEYFLVRTGWRSG
ncbi:hypothetical protein BC936DRAFT_142438 [Jimgerdemannia flammicorona]|uniref:ER membrane protein complex subunit 7 beta-sandwich domain-containing protein n=1 Tax=Jimgerdemannia flammicorona TaxID=994334 RepID=A0A433A0E2_9FUNG|nr:hypothetical protein BC936DRAFT_142438 [Jimgerdemannia flammicorona]